MVSSEFARKVTIHLGELYPEEDASALTRKCIDAIGIDGTQASIESRQSLWDSADIVLITYADSVVSSNQTPLDTINYLLSRYLKETVSVVHILPFFPYSSDDGFSVIDYSTVNPSHGNWEQLRQIKTNFKLMADLVLNHCSTRSLWFENFKTETDPGRNFFITDARTRARTPRGPRRPSRRPPPARARVGARGARRAGALAGGAHSRNREREEMWAWRSV